MLLRDGAVAFVVLGAGTGLAAPRRPLLRRLRNVDRFALDVFPYLYEKFLRQNFLRIDVAYRCTAFRNITVPLTREKPTAFSALSQTRFSPVGTPTSPSPDSVRVQPPPSKLSYYLPPCL